MTALPRVGHLGGDIGGHGQAALPPRRLLGALVVLAGLWSAVGLALAAGAPPAQACKADLAQHCGGLEPGDGRLATCLRQHMASLSSGCQAQLEQLEHCAGQVKAACGEARGRELRACLKDKAEQIDPACRRSRG